MNISTMYIYVKYEQIVYHIVKILVKSQTLILCKHEILKKNKLESPYPHFLDSHHNLIIFLSILTFVFCELIFSWLTICNYSWLLLDSEEWIFMIAERAGGMQRLWEKMGLVSTNKKETLWTYIIRKLQLKNLNN